MNIFNKDNIPEFKGQIVDIFEDFLCDNNYTLKNEEREAAIADDEYEDPEEAAIIWGDDYDTIADTVESVISGNDKEHISEAEIKIIMSAFNELCTENNIALTSEQTKTLSDKLIETFQRWGTGVSASNRQEV